MRIWAAGALALALALGGCAGEQAFRQGNQLIKEGKTEEGMAQLAQAVKENPKNLAFRTRYLQEKERRRGELLAEGDAARAAGHYAIAEAKYRQVLAEDAHNGRALAGLEALERAKKHDVLLAEARVLFEKGEIEEARHRVRAIMSENGAHAGATALLRKIEEKLAAENAVPTTLQLALKKPISLEFRDANIKSVFEVISRTSGINFVFDKDVRPDLKANIFVKNTTIEDAVKLLLLTNQLEQKILNSNAILIYPNVPAKLRDYQDLTVKSFYLANADVKQTANMLKTMVKTRDLFIDEKLGLVVMRDTPEAVRLAERLIALQDLAEPEVILAVEVLEVSRNRLQELGIRYPESIGATLGNAGTYTMAEWKNRDSNFVTYKITDPALILNLRKTDTDTNLLANPRIRVKNREKAKIHIGERLPVITTVTTANVGTSESVTYLDVGLKLDVEPNIHLDDEVDMKVGLEVSNLLETITRPTGTVTYRLGTRNTSTTLRLKHGETQILAGLIQDDERKTAAKVPGLGDIPLLGRLFSSHRDDNTKTEIVLLITPHIVRNLERPVASRTEFPGGTEASIGASPISVRAAENAPVPIPGLRTSPGVTFGLTPSPENAPPGTPGATTPPAGTPPVASPPVAAPPASSPVTAPGAPGARAPAGTPPAAPGQFVPPASNPGTAPASGPEG